MTKKEIIKNIFTHLSLLWLLTISFLVRLLASSDLTIILIFLLIPCLIARDVVIGRVLSKIFSDSFLKLTISIILTYIITLSASIILAFFFNRNSEGVLVHCTDCCGCMETTLQKEASLMAIYTLFPYIAIILSAIIFYFTDKRDKGDQKDKTEPPA